MLRSTSVVITTTGASPLTEESPVSSPTFSAPWRRDEVVVLLVRQRLDRGGVEGLAPRGEGQVHRELPDDGLARPRRGRDEHALAVLDGLARLAPGTGRAGSRGWR